MIVTLTWSEQLFAAQAGVMRRISAIHKKRDEPYKTPTGDLWGIDVESSGAEAAVAKALRRYWQPLSTIAETDGDVSGVEVRSTTRKDGHLIVHDRDKDHAPFVLVRGVFPVYDLVGWMYGRDAKQDQYKTTQVRFGYAYFVPDRDLRPLEELLVQIG